jgi:ketosteroid isomerase-like protein
MRRETEDLIRTGIAAFNRRDAAGIVASLHPEVELEPLRAVLEGSVYRGHDGARQWLDDMAEDWSDFEVEVEGTRELSDTRVLVEARVRAHARVSGVEVSSPGAWLCDLRDGKVSRIRFFRDVESALEVA